MINTLVGGLVATFMELRPHPQPSLPGRTLPDTLLFETRSPGLERAAPNPWSPREVAIPG
jgi:hypothetical protein